MTENIRPAIIVFPASNCEKDMAQVLQEVFSLSPILVWHTETHLSNDITHVILPGGFSFGDYLRAGALAAHSPIMAEVKRLARFGLPTLGVCNGFQILCEAKLLPGVLLRNHHDRFVCTVSRMTWFGARQTHVPQTIHLPIAHRDGRFYAGDATIDRLREEDGIALVYDDADENGDALVNGAKACIAGIVGGPKRNILGLMPHPERMASEHMLGSDGLRILKDFLFGQDDERQNDCKL
ncbi:MAG TPA: phosphoribosylformylglycinamidine synthase subunit PurQ [Myxococcota bacterium]|nr:phosphoribosylformylglycinamidine synthase subunit PurQ [Myxococcota bacterium]